MKRIICVVAVVTAIVCMMCGCKSELLPKTDKLNVVVTAFVHYDFVKQIAGDTAEITMLLKPGNEMHTYDPSVSDIAKISACDVFVYTGGESDTWAKSILESAKNENMRVVSFTEICPAQLCEDVSFGTAGETNTHDHHNHNYDEHVWTSPVNAQKLAKEIYNTLCEADKENAQMYTENYHGFDSELKKIDEILRGIVSASKRKAIVVGDRFPFAHLAKEYGLEYSAAFPGCSSETEPGAKTVAILSQKVRNEKIPVVFTVEFSNKKVANNIVTGTDAEILTLHSCHNVTYDEFLSEITYTELMAQNAENLRKALN